MCFNKIKLVFLISAVLIFCGCGDDSKKEGISLSGTLSFDESARIDNAPVLVAVLNTLDYHLLQDNPKQAIIKYVSADNGGTSFHVDLSDTGLQPGDEIYLISFIDNNYGGEVPTPDKGDVIGIYFEERDLRRQFGSRYEEYSKRVPMLVPAWKAVGRDGA